MSLILNIDTSTEVASICVAENENCLVMLANSTQKEHAAWLHTAIEDALQKAGKQLRELSAVGITAGPGSYTGLRVSMATAKGLCYSLNIPLVGINTLDAMASAAKDESVDYICPMIDARRMEVYTALYDKSLARIIEPCSMVLNETSFADLLIRNNIVFFGNGADKFKQITPENSAVFKNIIFNAVDLVPLIYKKFVKSDCLSLAYAEPVYLKEYYTR